MNIWETGLLEETAGHYCGFRHGIVKKVLPENSEPVLITFWRGPADVKAE